MLRMGIGLGFNRRSGEEMTSIIAGCWGIRGDTGEGGGYTGTGGGNSRCDMDECVRSCPRVTMVCIIPART